MNELWTVEVYNPVTKTWRAFCPPLRYAEATNAVKSLGTVKFSETAKNKWTKVRMRRVDR